MSKLQLALPMDEGCPLLDVQAGPMQVSAKTEHLSISVCSDAVSRRTDQMKVSLLVSSLLSICKQLLKVLAQALGQV